MEILRESKHANKRYFFNVFLDELLQEIFNIVLTFLLVFFWWWDGEGWLEAFCNLMVKKLKHRKKLSLNQKSATKTPKNYHLISLNKLLKKTGHSSLIFKPK
jgi:hypothetical protein